MTDKLKSLLPDNLAEPKSHAEMMKHKRLTENAFPHVRMRRLRQNEAFRVGLNGADQCVWYKAITSGDVVRQRVALAISEIFVINQRSLNGAGGYRNFACAQYMDLLERNSFGNSAPPISSETVKKVRTATGFRAFYSPEELTKEHPLEK